MLGAVFSFRGRIGRLQYFAGLVGLFVAVILAAVFAVFSLGSLEAVKADPSRALPALLIVLAAVPLWIWISLSLQARRLRDMGFNPLIVIPALIAFSALDQVLGAAIYGGGVMAMQHTPLEPLVNLAYSCCLLFWPGKPVDAPPAIHWDGRDERDPGPATPMRGPAPAIQSPRFQAPLAASPMTASPPRPAGSQPFGRRGL